MIPNRLVLDTNVCLDLFVFCDPYSAALATALQEGGVEAVTRADCRSEWLAVLQYPCFALDESRRAQCVARFDAVVRCLGSGDGSGDSSGDSSGDRRGGGSGHSVAGWPPGKAMLPRCTDKDDQKFLELARDSNASMLLTKDRALLKLAGKCRRAGLFAIIKPETWTATAVTAKAAAPVVFAGAATVSVNDRSD